MVSLDSSTSGETRFDLFERINTGSEDLKDAELRKGAFSGPFYRLVKEFASDPRFLALCPISDRRRDRGEGEELVLRFFAYSESYLDFRHDVNRFLNKYLKARNEGFDEAEMRARFERMIRFVQLYLPNGFGRAPESTLTPRVRFEAIAVGVHLALEQCPDLVPGDPSWLDSREFRRLTTSDASNSSTKLRGRVEYVRDALLGRLHA